MTAVEKYWRFCRKYHPVRNAVNSTTVINIAPCIDLNLPSPGVVTSGICDHTRGLSRLETKKSDQAETFTTQSRMDLLLALRDNI